MLKIFGKRTKPYKMYVTWTLKETHCNADDYGESTAPYYIERIEKMGYKVVTPKDVYTQDINPLEKDLFLIERLKLLSTCDGIFFIDEWQLSEECRIEQLFTLVNDPFGTLKAYFALCDVPEVVKKGE